MTRGRRISGILLAGGALLALAGCGTADHGDRPRPGAASPPMAGGGTPSGAVASPSAGMEAPGMATSPPMPLTGHQRQ